ncbi:TolC family protein [Hymenobacter sp. HD11105]
MKKYLLVLGLTLGGLSTVRGQSAPAPLDFFGAPELVLPRLYEAAITHSAEVAQREAVRAIASQDLKMTRKKPLSMLAFTSSYNYGTLPFFATVDGTPQRSQFNPFAQGARAQYSLGVNLVAPLDVLVNRRGQVHRQELVVDQAAAERRQVESEVRAQVILHYQQLMLARTTLQHYQDALQSASVSRKIADRRFKEGEIQVDEQMAAMDFYGKALLAQEEAKNKYQTAQLLLEDLIGMPITTLMAQR